jgi:Leucine-rich repeat (LRR) protein
MLSSLYELSIYHTSITGSIPTTYERLCGLKYFELYNNLLNGTIPGNFSCMSRILEFLVPGNFITGTLPSTIGNLRSLIDLDVGDNDLTGTIPTALANLVNLQTFDLFSCAFSGTIPAGIGSLIEMTKFGLDTNFLSGCIPASLSKATKLTEIYLYGNFISCSLPSDLFQNMSVMSYINMQVNKVTGGIPASIGNAPVLNYLNVQRNRLSVSLPASLGTLSSLTQILLGSNAITGVLPVAPNQTIMHVFEVYDNFLQGTIPPSYSRMAAIELFYVNNNLLSGTIPNGFENMRNARFLQFSQNRLSGTIPAALAELTQMLELRAHDNDLTGPLPRVQQMVNLTALLLYNNKLTGTLDNVFNATLQRALSSIQVSGNQLTGSLPEEVFRLPSLQTIAAVSNCFTGSLPANICNCTTLNAIALDGLRSATSCQLKLLKGVSDAYTVENAWRGRIPACLFAMPALTTLHLSGNGFSGNLPADLNVSASLTDLSLSHNVLTGRIPATVQRHGWSNLDLSYNRLTGTLDGYSSTGGENSTLYLDNNRFSGAVPYSIVNSSGAVRVLTSNLFTCKVDRSDLPQQDEDVDRYQCGSVSFNVPYFTWLGLAVAAVVTLCAVGWTRTLHGGSVLATIVSLTSVVQRRENTSMYEQVRGLFWSLWWLSARCTAVAVLVLAPLYVVLSDLYGTYTRQSAYLCSAAFLSGSVPAALVLVALLALALVLTLWFVAALQVHVGTAPEFRPTGTVTRPARERFAVYGAYILANILIVVGVNSAYVYVALYQSGSLLLAVQVLMSFFKLFWNKFCGNFLVLAISNYLSNFEAAAVRQYSREFLSVQLVVTLFNNIAVPCLVVSLVSPSCFYNALVAAPEVKASYTFLDCSPFNTWNSAANSCGFVPTTGTTSYSPLFTYSYECSATFVTYYAPAFLYMCITASLILPAWRLLASCLHQRATPGTRWKRVLELALPRIIRPVDPAESFERSAWVRVFDAPSITVSLLTYLGILLTFGAVFPPLAPPLLFTMGATIVFTERSVGAWIAACGVDNEAQGLSLIDAESAEVNDPLIMSNALWTLVTFSCWFYTLFIFDTLGDAVGLSGAFWVLIVMPLMPLCIYGAVRALSGRTVRGDSARTGSTAGMELHSTVAMAEKQEHERGVDVKEDVTLNVLVMPAKSEV